MPKAEHEIDIAAPPETVFDIVCDYERYPEFLPDMKAVRVESRFDGVSLVTFELELIMRITYTLRLEEDRPRAISWTLERAKMLEENVGGWLLSATRGGGTHVRYGLEIKLRGLIPKTVSTRLAGQTLPATLERFKARAEARAAGKKALDARG